MYKIKQLPEDFVVKELSSITPDNKQGYIYFVLKKTNYTTLDALRIIARKTGIPLKHFGYAGMKDRNAVTEQLCSVKGTDKRLLENISLKGISIKIIGSGSRPVCLGDLQGNEFEIVVRNIQKLPEKKERFINFFGEQRFGKNNAETGKAILKKEFKKAVELVLQTSCSFENEIRERLKKDSANYVAALCALPKKQLKMYINAFQSALWNRLAQKKINAKEECDELPIIGFDTVLDSEMREVLAEEGICQKDFIIPAMPELSAEGGSRKLFAKAENLWVGNLEEDELNNGMKKVLIKFKLAKGCYATEFIRQLFMPQESARCP